MTRPYPDVAPHLPVEIAGTAVDGSELTIWGSDWTLIVTGSWEGTIDGRAVYPDDDDLPDQLRALVGEAFLGVGSVDADDVGSSSATASTSSHRIPPRRPGGFGCPTTSSTVASDKGSQASVGPMPVSPTSDHRCPASEPDIPCGHDNGGDRPGRRRPGLAASGVCIARSRGPVGHPFGCRRDTDGRRPAALRRTLVRGGVTDGDHVDRRIPLGPSRDGLRHLDLFPAARRARDLGTRRSRTACSTRQRRSAAIRRAPARDAQDQAALLVTRRRGDRRAYRRPRAAAAHDGRFGALRSRRLVVGDLRAAQRRIALRSGPADALRPQPTSSDETLDGLITVP